MRILSSPVPTTSDNVFIYRMGAANPELSLTYSTIIFHPMGHPGDLDWGTFMGFGHPTALGGTPTTGSATYRGVAYGESLSLAYDVRGSLQLNFDFAAGSLSGFFDPVLITRANGASSALARQLFAQTSFARGGQTFSGTFAGIAGSAFDGQFTGPAAEEFIGRFQQPLPSPLSGDRIIGAWAGKR